MSGLRAPKPAPLPEHLGETIETSRSAFDPAPKPANHGSASPASHDHESTQYLISTVMPHPLARAPSNEPQPTPNPEPVPPPRLMPPPVVLPKPPVALFVAAGAIVLMVIVAVLYAITRR